MAMAINLMSRYFIVLLGVRHRHRAVSARTAAMTDELVHFDDVETPSSLSLSLSFSLCVSRNARSPPAASSVNF